MLYVPDPGDPESNPHESAVSLEEHPAGVMLKSASLVIIICAGTVENATVIYTIVKDRRLHRAPYYYMINLSVADLLKSVICLPFVLTTAMHGSVWRHGRAACKLLGFASTFFTFGAVFALFILALDRHMSVLHAKFHSRRFKGLMCLAMVLAGWAVAFLLAFPPVFGLGTYQFIPLEGQCSLEHRYYTNNDTLGFSMIFVAMIALTLFIYCRIYQFLRAHRRMRPIIYDPLRSQNWTFFGPAGVHILQPGQHLPPQENPIRQYHNNNNNIQRRQQYGNTNLLANGRMAWTNMTTLGGGAAQNQPFITARYVQTVSPKNEHLTRLFVTVNVVFDLVWLPYLAMCFWYMFDPKRAVPYTYATLATWLSYSQVATLPVVYFLGHAPFRHAVGRSLSTTTSTTSRDGYALREYTAP